MAFQRSVRIGALALALITTATALASTVWTYQGRLKNGGALGSGQYDFQFSLWDAATAGSQQGSTLSFDGVGADPAPITVTGGLFTVQLDFGNQFPGAARWLEIAVRPHAVGGYTTLAPRQPLTPAPYALDIAWPVTGSVNTGADALLLSNTGSGNGVHASGNNGVLGESPISNGIGVSGIADTGAAAYGVYGHAAAGFAVVGVSGSGVGVTGSSTTGNGINGFSGSATGVTGTSTSGAGVAGSSGSAAGVSGSSTSGDGSYGTSGTGPGMHGLNTGSTEVISAGVFGESSAVNGNGVTGISNNGIGAFGVFGASTSGWAGFFEGKVHVTGMLEKAGGGFLIDHPQDPANKYLWHSFVESPDMKNVYDGVATTDANGLAVVTMPEWFQTVNRDFRYQLTVMGQFAQAIVAQEIENNQFTIQTDKPNVRVSWQVTGIRQDPWANANRRPAEYDKSDIERGFYLHPELYGQPAELNMVNAKARTAGQNPNVSAPAAPSLPSLPPGKEPVQRPDPPVPTKG